MLQLLSIEPKPFHQLWYLNASSRGRAESARLGFHRGRVTDLPQGCETLVVTSDLQGMAPARWGEPASLLGVAVAAALAELDLGMTLAILAGDLWSVPEANKRGGFGDVSPVWSAFADSCAWVVGVAGNHDDVSCVSSSSRVHLLDGSIATIGGVRFGGVGYIAGNAEKNGRRSEDEQFARLADAVVDTDVLVLHEAPTEFTAFEDAIVEAGVPLVVCGHRATEEPLAHLSKDVQLVNVHERVLVLSH